MSDWAQANCEVGRRLRWMRTPKAQHSLRYGRQSAPSQRGGAWCSGVFCGQLWWWSVGSVVRFCQTLSSERHRDGCGGASALGFDKVVENFTCGRYVESPNIIPPSDAFDDERMRAVATT